MSELRRTDIRTAKEPRRSGGEALSEPGVRVLATAVSYGSSGVKTVNAQERLSAYRCQHKIISSGLKLNDWKKYIIISAHDLMSCIVYVNVKDIDFKKLSERFSVSHGFILTA